MAVVKNLMVRSGADFSQLYSEMNKAQKKVGVFKTTIGKTLKGLGLAFSGVAVGKLVTDFTKTAMRTEVLDVAMKSVARASGYATQALQEHRKAVMDMGIAEQEASQILTRFMQAQLDTADAAKLARVAQDAAVIAGMDSSQAAEQMTEAIAKRRPILLSQFGMMSNLQEMYREYAKTIGKTANQLTNAEQKQAMLNHILKEGEKIAGTYEASMGVVGKQISSLPRYWHTLQNAIATPLALPGLGEAVEGITSALKNAISWAEANKDVLRRWGQSIAGVVRTVVKGFSLITGAIVENWQALKFAGTTLLTYIFITKGAAVATTAWRIATLTLKGELMTQVPVLSAVSTAIGTYRLQMALAPAATNVFTGALLRLRVALYAVHTALGPIGWAVLALSAAASGGMEMWNKYSQSLQKTASLGFGDFRKAQDGVAGSTGVAAEAAEDQADAIEKAGKAAKKSLAGFDEIHQLQKDMAGGSGAGEDVLDEFDLGGIGGGGIGGLGMDDMLAELEQAKPTISGFWEWIKQGAGSIWDDWSNYVQSWGWVQTLSDWIVDTFYDAEKGAWSLKRTWQKWTDYVQSWGWVQGLTDWIVGVLKKWGDFKASAGETWENIKSFIKTKWNDLSTGAKSTWANIKDTVQTSWNNLKKDAPAAWENIKNTISTKANNTRDALTKTWAEISKRTADVWASIKASTGTAWDNIKTYLGQTWGGIQTNIGNALTTTRNTITNTWNSLRSTTQTVWGNIKNAITSPIESAKRTVLNIIDNIKNAFANMRITIPKPKLPHISVSTKTKKIGNISIPYPDFDINWYAQGAVFSGPSVIGVGEAGAEAVLPLERNTGWMDTLAAKIATSIPGGAGGGSDVYVYIGNEQVDAYVYRSQDRRNVKSNGR